MQLTPFQKSLLRIWLGVGLLLAFGYAVLKIPSYFTYHKHPKVVYAQGNGYNSARSLLFTGAGSDITLVQNSLMLYHEVIWTPTSMSACTVTIDSSPDGVTWTTGGIISAQTCTSGGHSVVVNAQANYIRISVGSFTGTSVLIQYEGWAFNPVSGGASQLTANQIAAAIKCNDTSITVNQITCAPINAPTSYVDGELLLVKVANTNTAATQINVSGLGNKSVTESGGNAVALNGGELIAGSPYYLQYDGTRFQNVDLSYFECDKDPGATLDAKIADGIVAGGNNKAIVIDCRNVSGTPNVTANPFASLTEASYTASVGGFLLWPLQQVNINHPVVIPSAWQQNGNAAQFSSGSNGTFLKAGASLKAKYLTGTINSTSCSAGPPITCTITGNSGTNWVTSAAVTTDMHFTLCATGGGNSSANCTTSATNAVDGRITSVASDTSIVIDSVTQSASNGAGAYNYVIWSPILEMGTEAASTAQPASFGVQLSGLKIDANGVSGAVPVYNRSCQNLCGFNGPIYVNWSDSAGLMLMGNQAQNSGPYTPFWAVCQVGNCTSTSVGAIVRGGTSVPINLQGWSVAANAVANATPISIGSPAWLISAHVLAAGTADGVGIDTNFGCPVICDVPEFAASGGGVLDFNAAAGGTGAAVHLGNNLSPVNYQIAGIKAPASAGWTNTLKDDVRTCTITNAVETTVGLYEIGQSANTFFSTSEVSGCSGISLGSGSFTLGAVGVGTGSITFKGLTSGSGSLGCLNAVCGVTAFGTTNNWNVKRIAVDAGTTLVAGDFALSAGWGTTASIAITVATSKDPAAVVTVTSAGTGQAANPTIAFTFHNGTWTNVPACTAIQTGGTGIFGDSTVSVRSATAYTWIWNATPTAAQTYEFTIQCTGT